MGEQVTIDTEMTPTETTGVPTGTVAGEGAGAGETGQTLPTDRRANFGPIDQGKQVVVGTGQVGGEDESEVAGRTFGGQGTDFSPASGTEISLARRAGVAGAQARVRVDGARGKPHHQQRTGGLGMVVGDGWGGDVHQEFAEVLFVQGHPVARGVAVVGLPHQLLADGHLGRQSHHLGSDLVCHQAGDGLVDVARVGGV